MHRSSISDSYLRERYTLENDGIHWGSLERSLTAPRIITATDTQTGMPVVLRLTSARFFKPESVYRFQTELEVLSAIDCRSFVRPIDWGLSNDIAFSARSFRVAIPLQEVLAAAIRSGARPGLSVAQVLSIAADLLEALHLIHQCGCVYRNVCLSRVSLDGSRAMLVAPGPDDYLEPAAGLSTEFMELAKFASPERSGSIEHDIGPASDLYSLGVMIFWLLSGRAPFDGDSIGSILFQHIAHDPNLQWLGADVPPVVTEIVDRLLRKEPRDRYQSATAALADISQVKEALQSDRITDRLVIGRQDTRNTIIEPAFVGRTMELAELDARLTQVASGESQRVAIVCPSGIGKSRIVLEAIRLATRKGFYVFRSLASNQAGQIPTASLQSIVEQLVTQVRQSERLRDRLHDELLEYREEIATVFPDLAAELHWPRTATVDKETLGKARLEAAFCQVLASIGDQEHPAFIWLDDCQWLDLQSLGILEKLQSSMARNSIFIFSLRPNEGVSASFVERVRSQLTIELHAFSSDEVQAMIESMAGRLPAEAVETVIKLAEGSPFMASAILRGMAESGALQATPQGWKVDFEKLSKIQASANAAEALLRRLENVPLAVLRQLSFAAIIGKEFDERTVVELSPISAKESKACFEWSRQQRLIWSTPNGNLTFVHDKIRETLIARLMPEERKQIHLSYAEYLKQLPGDFSFELAFHYDAAESYQEALPYALQAAATARKLHSLDRAEELMRIALHGLDNADRRTRHQVHAGLADVLMLAGKYDEAEPWFEKSLDTVDSPMDVALIGLKRGELAFKRGDKESATKLFSAALKELKQTVPEGQASLSYHLLRELAVQVLHSVFPRWFVGRRTEAPSEESRLSWRLHSRIAHGYWYTKDKFHVLWAHLRGMNLSERYAPTPELAQAYSEHAPAMSLIPWHKRGIQYVQRSLKIRESLNDIWGQGQSRNFYSILLYSSSQYESCILQASHAESILLRTGDYWEVNIARYQLAASLYRMGDLKGALDVARRTYDSALAIGDYQSTGNIIDVWVRAALCEMPDEILAAEKTRTLRDRQGECQVLLAEGIQYFGKKRYVEAAACFDKAISIAENAGVVNTFITPNYPWKATALRMALETNPPKSRQARRRAWKQLHRAARRAVRVSRAFQNELPHALREWGAACGLRGQVQRSHRAFHESMAIATAQKAEYELALTQQLYGEMGREFGWPDAETLRITGINRVREIRQSIQQSGHRESMSLVDRFDTLLEAGRQIISANSAEAIFGRTREAAERLLRGQRTLIIEANHSDGTVTWTPLDPAAVYDQALVQQVLESRKTVVSEHELMNQKGQPIRHSGAFLCCPITVHDQVAACLYVANEFLSGLYGKNEIRIADYLASAAGGALEKADGFQKLEQLNISLEQKVLERTAAVETRSRELEVTAQELIATQSKLELARDEAQSANAAKSEFLARMSHEIRTPISAILGFTELMLRGVVRDPLETVQKLETIHTNGSHLLQLINDLLDLSKIEADKMEVESIDCVPVQVLHEVLTSLQVRADQKSIGLEMRIDGSIPRQIKSDPTRLRQILTNLIGNAIKFTSVGQVVVTMRTAASHDMDDRLDFRSIEFEIADSGIGMEASQLDKIFDPFTQADSTVTRKFGGTGLGLSISKQLAEALGGGISVQSQVGVGSTFTVWIPAGHAANLELWDAAAAKKFVAQTNTKRRYRADLTGCRILIVDDVQTNRELLSLFLKDCGASVEAAVHGQEAIDLASGRNDLDVILMDMQMPVLDGFSATRALREQGYTKPIIALTANSMKGDEARCLSAGCSDYLSKPIDINCLLQKVCEIYGAELVESETAPPMPMASNGHPPTENHHSVDRGAGELDQGFEALNLEEPFRTFALEFIDKVELQSPELHEAVAAEDFAGVSRIAHWIKGTGGTVGLTRVSELAKDVEKAARGRDSQALKTAVDQLSRCFARLKPSVCS